MKKIQCQLIDWVSTPPASSPTAPPAEATKANTPIALACSRGSGNIVTIMPRITAEVSAPPAPWTNRATTSVSSLLASPQTIEASGEDRQAAEEQPAPAEQVTEPAGQQQQAAERDQVGVDHPGQARRTRSQVGLDVGQRHVHDGDVENDHQHAGAQHVQRDPAGAVGGHQPASLSR